MNDTPTPNKDELNLDNLPLKEALRFVDENSTTGGLFTKATLKTLAAGCRELTAVTEQRDRLAEALKHVAEGSSCCACRGSVELVSIADKALAAVEGGKP